MKDIELTKENSIDELHNLSIAIRATTPIDPCPMVALTLFRLFEKYHNEMTIKDLRVLETSIYEEGKNLGLVSGNDENKTLE